MKKIGFLSVLAIVAFSPNIGCCLCGPRPKTPADGPARKIAVLASTEVATSDKVKYNSEFWFDLVANYCTLIDSGFDADDIYVLYGDGADYPSLLPGYQPPYCGDSSLKKITDFKLMGSKDVQKDNLCNVLCCLSYGRPAKLNNGDCACKKCGTEGTDGFTCSGDGYDIPRLKSNDHLTLWIKGHGNTENCQTSLKLKEGRTLRDDELSDLIEALLPDRRAMFFETCCSGGWLDDLADENTVVAAATGVTGPDFNRPCQQTAWTGTYDEVLDGTVKPVFHGRFSRWMSVALDGGETIQVAASSDADTNNLVSIEEAVDFATDRIIDENVAYSTSTPLAPERDFGGLMNPTVADPARIGPCIFIRLPFPGEDSQIYSRDHPDDDALVPTILTAGAASPDVWVRNVDDGLPGHQPLITGIENHIYARVYNIGCADPGQVAVNFYWASLAVPDQWRFIGSGTLNTLPPVTEDKVHCAWNVEHQPPPNGGPYWLIAELDAPGDSPNDNPKVAYDNNKVRISTTVLTP